MGDLIGLRCWGFCLRGVFFLSLSQTHASYALFSLSLSLSLFLYLRLSFALSYRYINIIPAARLRLDWTGLCI